MGDHAPQPADEDLAAAGAINDFLAVFLADRAAGRLRAVADYQAQFPAHAAAIAAEYLSMTAGAAPPALPAIPQVLIEREIGRGGQGVVYRGRQTYIDRVVAVKVLTQTFAEPRTDRFRREARTLAGLTHPHIVSCYQAGVTDDGHCYLVMEFVDGPNLRWWLEEHGRLPLRAALHLARDLANALAYAQTMGIVHRDVKPENVLLQPDPAAAPFPWRPKLADLGLARPLQLDLRATMATPSGTVIGTPATMAPEQFDAPDQVDHRADMYGLGCVLYHALTGVPAFAQTAITELLVQKAAKLGPDPRREVPGLPAAVAELVMRLLARAPADRPAGYEPLLAELDRCLPPPRTRRSAARVLGFAGLLAAIGTAAFFAWQATGARPADVRPASEQPMRPVGLFDAGANPFANSWECSGQGGRDGADEPTLNRADGIGLARRPLAAGEFTLTGRIDPRGRYVSDAPRPMLAAGVRIEFGDAAVQIELTPIDGRPFYIARLRSMRSAPDGDGWREVEPLGASTVEWSTVRPLPFRCEWQGGALLCTLGGDEAALVQRVPSPDRSVAAPTSLSLFVDRGLACFAGLELRQR